tara:strand:- start:2497 stop:2805 length:309 start_codon:yes stop_codon:yes gene_type:complete
LFKENELFLTATGVIAGISAWIIRKLFRDSEKLAVRITSLEKSLVDRKYLETQLAPIRADLNLILSHLLEHRKTEKDDPHGKGNADAPKIPTKTDDPSITLH